jgi:indole-3-glycerol phosphate synthase
MTILDRIIDATRALVARRKDHVPMARLEEQPLFHAPTRPLAAALRQAEGLAFLAEIKQASPSKGVLRADFDPVEIARSYARHGAAALSVLTEPTFFQGSLDDLARVRQAVDLPLLRKDFIVDPYQLVEARAHGADAVLLIAAVLDRAQLHDLHQAATGLGLSCLVELYDPGELDRVDLDHVRILGVNNRDLRTFEVDVARSLRVFAHVPPGVVRVSESGLRGAAELAHLHRHGVDAVLIGETFMRAADPGAALGALKAELAAALAAA